MTYFTDDYDIITPSNFIDTINDYNNITSTNYTDALNDYSDMTFFNCTNIEKTFDIIIPTFLLTIPYGLLFFCSMSLMVYTLNKPFIH